MMTTKAHSKLERNRSELPRTLIINEMREMKRGILCVCGSKRKGKDAT